MTWFARGLGAARLGQPMRQASQRDSAEADPGAPREGQRTLLGAAGGNPGSCAVAAWSALAAGKKEEALRQMNRQRNWKMGRRKVR